jgi:uncharacterized protein YbjT (DUF2867 family)
LFLTKGVFMRIAITGPTGHVGRKVVRELLDRGQRDLVLLARDPDKLSDERERGATIAHGDLTDADFVAASLYGVEAVFWIVPPNSIAPNLRTYQAEVARIGASAAKAAGVQHVVLLSSFGADAQEGTGPILGLHDAEQIFRVAVPGLTILRPAMFMENYLMQLDAIRQRSSIFLPVPGQARVPMIATEDIARAAADALLAEPPQGTRVLTLTGPRQYSFDEAASIIGQAIGRPVHHVQITDDQARQSLLAMGASANVADRMVEMYEGINHDLMLQQPPENQKTTPTTFEQFAASQIRPAMAS